MPTIVMFDNERITFAHPSHLPQQCSPRIPPLQPIASWGADLTLFQAMCVAGAYFDALRFLRANWLQAKTSDIPAGGGGLAGFKAYVAKIYGPGGPYGYLDASVVPIAETSAGLPPNLYVADGANWEGVMSFHSDKIKSIVENEKLSATEKRDKLAEFDNMAASVFAASHSNQIHFEATEARRARDAELSELEQAKLAELKKSGQKTRARIDEMRATAKRTGNPGLAMLANLSEEIARPDLYAERALDDSEPPSAA